MNELTAIQARLLGCLMEKKETTPRAAAPPLPTTRNGAEAQARALVGGPPTRLRTDLLAGGGAGRQTAEEEKQDEGEESPDKRDPTARGSQEPPQPAGVAAGDTNQLRQTLRDSMAATMTKEP